MVLWKAAVNAFVEVTVPLYENTDGAALENTTSGWQNLLLIYYLIFLCDFSLKSHVELGQPQSIYWLLTLRQFWCHFCQCCAKIYIKIPETVSFFVFSSVCAGCNRDTTNFRLYQDKASEYGVTNKGGHVRKVVSSFFGDVPQGEYGAVRVLMVTTFPQIGRTVSVIDVGPERLEKHSSTVYL